jgi:hypothetical protein
MKFGIFIGGMGLIIIYLFVHYTQKAMIYKQQKDKAPPPHPDSLGGKMSDEAAARYKQRMAKKLKKPKI